MQKLWGCIQKKRHVIWDWNGTLLNDLDLAVNTVNFLLQKHGLKPIDQSIYRKLFGFPVRDYYEAIGFDFRTVGFETLSQEFVELYMQGFKNCTLVSGIEPILRQVKAAHALQSVLSASDQNDLELVISHFDIGKYFDHLFGIENRFASSKVHRGIELLDRSGIAASDSVIIGDTLHDLEVGQHLGVSVVLVAHGHQSYERLSAVHDLVIERP
jgi:phosphoglycolate phosphatase